MKIKEIKIREDDGSYSDPIPIGADASNVETKLGASNVEEDLDQLQKDIIDIESNLLNMSKSIENARNPKATEDSANLGPELLTANGWITTGWTGDFSVGFTHIIGQTTALEYPLQNTGTKKFQVSFDVESPTPAGVPNASTAFAVVIGNSLPTVTYDGGGSKHYNFGIESVQNGNLKFILTKPASPLETEGTFDGTIKNISVKEITNQYASTTKYYDTNGKESFEIRVAPQEQADLYIGRSAGEYNTTGSGNTGIGVNSLKNNTTGYWNTSIGYRCMERNTLGSRNVGIGYLALNENQSGDRNYAIGTFALERNLNGRCNVAIGADTLWCITSGSYNVAVGSASQCGMTTNSYNTSIGQSALSNATKGNNQIAIGYLAAGDAPGGNYNIAIGRQALYKTDAENNIGIGYTALGNNISGTQNVALGNNCLVSGKTNNFCTAIGHCAGQFSTGSGNTIIGHRAGINLSGNNNVIIGTGANIDGTTNYNSICIGYGSKLPSNTTGYLLSLGNVLYGDLAKGLLYIGKNKTTLNFGALLEIGTEENIPPLKFTTQSALVENPMPGSFEYYNNKLYFTIGNGTRYEIQLNAIQ